MTSDPRANPDPARPVREAANLGVARPPLVYSGSIALGVILHFAWPVSLLPRSVRPGLGAPFAWAPDDSMTLQTEIQ